MLMKTFIPIITLFLLSACSNKKDNNGQNDTPGPPGMIVTTPDSGSIPPVEVQPAIPVEQYYAWNVDYEAQTKQRNPQLTADNLNADSIITWLNSTHPNVQLQKMELKHDTIVLEIPDSEYLTQRMGSTGPQEYLSKVVLNLTAVAGIRFVQLEFEEGDHASPGVWSKKNFAEIKTIP